MYVSSRRVDQLIDSLTDRQYREAEEAYESFHPDGGGVVSFEDFIESPEFEEEFDEEIEEVCRYGVIRESIGLGRAHYVGDRLYDGSLAPRLRRDRDHHANGPSYGRSDGQRTGRGEGYGAPSASESLARESGSINGGGGRDGPGPSLPSGTSNAHGSGSAIIGGRGRCCGAPPPPDLRRVARDRYLGKISSFFGGSSHRHGNQQGPHSQARNVGYGSHGDSTDRRSGRRDPANDR